MDLNESVRYGDLIQLQHVLSGKFLTVSNERSDIELQHTKVVLTAGSPNSFFQFRPRYKLTKSRSDVIMGEQVRIVSTRRKGREFSLHSDPARENTFDVARDTRNEVNMSSDTTTLTAWRLLQFTKYDVEKADCLQVGQAIRIFHPDADAFVAAGSDLATLAAGRFQKPKQKKRFDHSIGAANSAGTDGAGEHANLPKIHLPKIHQSREAELKPPYLQKSRAALDPDSEANVSAKQIFVIEKANPFEGGYVQWNETYRFRHLASNRYLAIGHPGTGGMTSGMVDILGGAGGMGRDMVGGAGGMGMDLVGGAGGMGMDMLSGAGGVGLNVLGTSMASERGLVGWALGSVGWARSLALG
jgi:hypothetical protein